MPSLPIFATPAEVARYLKENGVGAVCGIAKSTPKDAVKSNLRRKGLLVWVQTKTTHREVTLQRTDPSLVEKDRVNRGKRRASGRGDHEETVTQTLARGLKVGEEVRVKGSEERNRFIIRREWGANNYSATKTGKDWLVKRLA